MCIHVSAAVGSGNSCHLPALRLAEPGFGASFSRFLPLRSVLLILLLQSGSSSLHNLHSFPGDGGCRGLAPSSGRVTWISRRELVYPLGKLKLSDIFFSPFSLFLCFSKDIGGLELRVPGYVLAMCYTLRPGFRGRNVVNCTEPCCAISAKWLTWSFVNDSCTRIASRISLVRH
ncbi:hypothetical protein COCSADRAFT_266212 [Bipolaris sorokiniana ND90Pr]|uniref:Uncharacterized protein n=1 Tax=Cochliobolus sativus (strain ND90Pr / ATCC 201652) TaxID=665912 RepID=M2RUA6_COCSN|nr:uncharacterized protein COCSADRAFT_266212 [Bipolaris sorokiniana ND90Pr]EMD58753.1 hypothetical protein COCSADRAFT_266212 [Bipolaris sorokiniana ND90Pr]